MNSGTDESAPLCVVAKRLLAVALSTNMRALALLVGVISLCGAIHPAQATPYNPITWSVTGDFDDGTTFSGTFSLNGYGYLTAPTSIMTNSGLLPAETYTASDPVSIVPGSPPANGFYITIYGSDPVSADTLELVFSNSLETPGMDPLIGGVNGPSYECLAFTCGGTDGVNTRYVTLGSAISTPLPAAWSLMLLGLAALGFVAYRRRSLIPLCA
jgi:hypothetical protein